MYVVPTPFKLIEGVAHHRTLILPIDMDPGNKFTQVGELHRYETAELVVAYSFNLTTNEITSETVPNPSAGQEHIFRAWRLNGDPTDQVSMANNT
ncbi:MAG: hypothetical protein GX550_07935 [Syntrophomonadaceae bacterium]|nr:hypothetical protein [Syntrophomonadaceae bacterium]